VGVSHEYEIDIAVRVETILGDVLDDFATVQAATRINQTLLSSAVDEVHVTVHPVGQTKITSAHEVNVLRYLQF
jgi:hypothetical protein